MALIPITAGSSPGAFQQPLKRWDPLMVFLGVPVVVLALFAAAVVEINFRKEDGLGYWMRMIAASLTLGTADGALSGSIFGNRSMFEQENQQRYVGISVLRGESNFSNTLPNLAGALRDSIAR